MTIDPTRSTSEAASQIWNAIVIGAGPAGSLAAYQLARRGFRTLLLDRSQFPRSKVCGCCLNRNALAALDLAGLGDLPTRLGGIPLDRISLSSNATSATLKWPGGVSVSREALDAELIRKAIHAGAEFIPGHSAKMGNVTDNVRSVEVGTETLFANVVILADGLNSQIAGEAVQHSRIGAGCLIPDPPPWVERGTVYMSTSKGGYVGAVLVEDGRLDLAAALDAAFVRANGGLGPAAMKILQAAGWPEYEPILTAPWKGTPALTRTARQISGRRWFAIGDAAGYIEPFTGEGMGWAFMSALAVMPTAVAATTGWNDELKTTWTKRYNKIVRRRQKTCRVLAWALKRPVLCSIAIHFLRILPGLASPVINSLHQTEFDHGGLR